MKTNQRRHSQEFGFTLIELIVALSLLAVVTTIAYGALSGILHTKQILDDSRDTRAVAHAILLRLSRELQLADPKSVLLPPKDNPKSPYPARVTLVGEPKEIGNNRNGDTLTFLALEGGQYMPDGGAHSGVVQITYRVEKDPDSNESGENETFYLVREETPLLRPAENAYKKSMVFPLTKNLVSLQFKYYDRDNEEWLSFWGKNDRVGLPAMVQFTFQLRSSRGQVKTLSSTVPLKATAG